MFGGEEESAGGMFAEEAPVNTGNQRMPVMSGGGLFGGDALKDNEVSAPTKSAPKQGGGNSRLKNIFDDEDEDDNFEEVKKPTQPMGGSKPTGFGGK